MKTLISVTAKLGGVLLLALILSQTAGAQSSFSRTDISGVSGTGTITADFNGDRKLDLGMAYYYAATVSVFLNNGDGTFATRRDSDYMGQTPMALAAGDFNRDGRIDIAVANAGDSPVSFALGNGDGSFGPRGAYDYGTNSVPALAVGDFNDFFGPDAEDLAVINGGCVQFLLGERGI